MNVTESECNVSGNLNDLTLTYPWNTTFTNLSIVYDIIYAKYSFYIGNIQCAGEDENYF